MKMWAILTKIRLKSRFSVPRLQVPIPGLKPDKKWPGIILLVTGKPLPIVLFSFPCLCGFSKGLAPIYFSTGIHYYPLRTPINSIKKKRVDNESLSSSDPLTPHHYYPTFVSALEWTEELKTCQKHDCLHSGTFVEANKKFVIIWNKWWWREGGNEWFRSSKRTWNLSLPLWNGMKDERVLQ